MRRQAFTAIELCVVLALILILAIILMPALEEGRVKAIEAKCLSRVRQVGVAFTLYQNAHNSSYPWARVSVEPDHPDWPDPTGSLALLYPAYAPQTYLFACPTTHDVVDIDHAAGDFVNCSNWYVTPSGRPARPEAKGEGAPQPPSYFYDAGTGEERGVLSTAAPSRVIYGDSCIHGVTKGKRRDVWLGKDNHRDGGNFLFADKHVAWLPQQWEGRPRRLGDGVPTVPNPYVQLADSHADPNVFTDDTEGHDRNHDAHLSGMMWVDGEWWEE